MRRLPLPAPLEHLADTQARCVSREQLREHGLDADLVARRVTSGAWRAVGPLAVVLHTGPLAAAERRWCAVLGTEGVLGGLAALEVHGLRSWDREEVDVVVPRSAGRAGPAWARLRTSTRRAEHDVTRRGGLPVHRVERAALDAASWSSSPRTAGGLVAAVVQQRLTTAERLLAAAEEVRTGHHRREVVAVLRDVACGSQALSEVDLVRLCRRYRLPLPVRQARREDGVGRTRYLDAEWLRPDGSRVLLEVDGVGHLDEAHWYDDLLRAAEITRAGEVLVRLPAPALRAEPERVAALLRRLLDPSAGAVR
ncbi:hypothetical protein WDZ16_04385 [Pseudokineococcus marinus]|uniref:DUF559 domain-containing protein n=1 Tax=Pseudokineococcus marinus TaxID=351215 RepID=A0A849BMU8_9ACTN|nr:hypothetical protein [Pseudokineococcus marinus]NNH22705.1 hypothetical protein [Pseudokineococcus marinus]